MRALTAGGLLLILTFRGASAQGASVDSLQFASYPAASRFHTAPAPVDLRSHKLARRFRTVLRKGAARGPNFAGAFTIVTWGCGSSCRLLAVVSARSGRVYGPGMQYMVAVAFKPSSRLLLIDPPDSVRAIFGASLADDRCVVCGTPGAYLWENDHFRALVQGPHVVSHTRGGPPPPQPGCGCGPGGGRGAAARVDSAWGRAAAPHAPAAEAQGVS